MKFLSKDDLLEAASIMLSPECIYFATDDNRDVVRVLHDLQSTLNNINVVSVSPIPGVLIQIQNYVGKSVMASCFALKSARRQFMKAGEEFLKKFWQDCNIDHIIFYVREDNRPSIWTMFSIGAREAGRLKQVTSKNGKLLDYRIFQLRRGE